MIYRITAEAGHLKAELSDRETVGETQSFFRAVVRANSTYQRRCVLIVVRFSKPIFQVVPHRLVEYFEELRGTTARQIALVGGSRDLHMSHEYIELIARQRGLDVRSFRDEAAALRWFRGHRAGRERRQVRERRQRQERRGQDERRHTHRRAISGMNRTAG